VCFSDLFFFFFLAGRSFINTTDTAVKELIICERRGSVSGEWIFRQTSD